MIIIFDFKQFKMQLRHDNEETIETDENEEILTKSDDLKEKHTSELKKGYDTVSIKSDSDEVNYSIERLEEFDDDEVMNQELFDYCNDEENAINKKENHKTLLEFDTDKNSDAKESPNVTNDYITFETETEENFNLSEELKQNSILKLNKNTNIFVVMIDDEKTNNSEVQLEKINDYVIVQNKQQSNNNNNIDEGVEKSKNNLTILERATKNNFNMPCGCGAQHLSKLWLL